MGTNDEDSKGLTNIPFQLYKKPTNTRLLSLVAKVTTCVHGQASLAPFQHDAMTSVEVLFVSAGTDRNNMQHPFCSSTRI